MQKILNTIATVLSCESIAPATCKLAVLLPQECEVKAGQFAHIRVELEGCNPLLRRPFSVYNCEDNKIEFLFVIRGKGSQILAEKKPGGQIGFLGPLGNHFEIYDRFNHFVIVAGGAGIVPFFLISKQILLRNPQAKLILLFGAKKKDELYTIEDLKNLPIEILTSTDDGSYGEKGFVTDILVKYLEGVESDTIQMFACGPDPMLKKVAEIATSKNINCQLSLETRMGCGLGACRACVTKVRDSNDWRYSRVCCEGPNYKAQDLFYG